MRKNSPLLAFALTAFTVGCGAPPPVKPMEMGKGDGGAAQCDPAVYPCAPYGYTEERIIADLTLPGRKDSNKDGITNSGDALVNLTLSDYFRDKKIKVVFVDVSAEWCNPCKAAQPTLVKVYNKYKAAGQVVFLEAIAQDRNHLPSDIAVTDRWATTYKLPFHMAADPTNVLGPYYNENAFPMEMVIRTRDMKILWQTNGGGPGLEQELTDQIEAAMQ